MRRRPDAAGPTGPFFSDFNAAHLEDVELFVPAPIVGGCKGTRLGCPETAKPSGSGAAKPSGSGAASSGSGAKPAASGLAGKSGKRGEETSDIELSSGSGAYSGPIQPVDANVHPTTQLLGSRVHGALRR